MNNKTLIHYNIKKTSKGKLKIPEQLLTIVSVCIKEEIVLLVCNLIKESTDHVTYCVVEVDSAEGLAVDWIDRKLYWTDSSRDVIRAANLETGETVTVISTGLVNPRGIAVHPTRR